MYVLELVFRSIKRFSPVFNEEKYWQVMSLCTRLSVYYVVRNCQNKNCFSWDKRTPSPGWYNEG